MKKFLLMICSLVFVLNAWAQERLITGKVTASEDASALPGVNVVLKGTTTGTVTDSDGNFKITVPSSGGNLVFSFIGLATQEIAIGDRTVLDVQLGMDVKQLSEIVVTGTGVATEKRKLGISVESVNADKLPAAPTASLDQALIGKIAGAQIQSVSGQPGAQAQILLRGINSLQRGTTPMILVDGVQMYNTALNTLDLSAVEKVEVVQGAAAATIYGAQGANGVIQIFTKRGKAGQMNIDISSSMTRNEYLNVGGLKKATLHAFDTDGAGNVVDPGGVPLTLDPTSLQWSGSIVYDALNPTSQANKPYVGNLHYVDHFKEFLQPAYTRNNAIRISGGKDKSDYAVSVSNIHQESNIKNGGYNDRTNLSLNLGMELFKGLTFRSTTQLAYTRNTVNSYIYGVFNTRPFADFENKNTQGLYAPNYGGASGVNGYNPNYYSSYTDNLVNTIDVVKSFNLNYKFPKFLELDTRYGLNHQQLEQTFTIKNESANLTVNDDATGFNSGYWLNNTIVPLPAFSDVGTIVSGLGGDYHGEIDNYNHKSTFHNWLSKATVSFDFAKDFNMNLPIKTTTLALFDYRKNVDSYYNAYAAGLPTSPPYTAAYGNTFRVVQGSGSFPNTGHVPFVTFGYLIQQRIEWGDIAGVSAGFRSDYSSAFGKGSKAFTFPRGDAFFRVSGLNFWDNSAISKVLFEWKIRAAYGEAGIQPYAFDRYVTISPQPIGAQSGYKFYNNALNAAQPNPNLNVEVSSEKEIGTDMTFNVLDNTAWLNNITLSATYWKRNTNNAIWNVDVAPSTGVGQLKDNAFSLGSHGIQFSLNTQLYHSGNFSWNLTTNFGKQSSEITGINGPPIVLLSSAGSTGYTLQAGQKVGQLLGYLGLHQVNAIDPATSQPYIDPSQQANYSVASNGWVVDSNSKQPYFTPNLYPFGDPNPKFNMSFINSLSYKDFLNFGFQFDWINGSHLYNQTKEWMYRDGIHSDYNNPLTINGESGNWTAFYRGVYAQVSRNGTKNYFYEDASFLRLRNVNVSIDFAKLANIRGFKKLQLVLTGRNLWTKTKYTGMDPEISSGTTNSSWDRAVDHNTLPNFKSYQVGLNIGF